MAEIWRNLLRRKVRTSLTILGIVIGVLALTVMGSLAERMNLMVSGAMRYYGSRIVVQDAKSSSMMVAARPLSLDYLPRLEAVEGVRAALPTIYLLLEEEMGSVSFGMPPLIMGIHPQWSLYDKEEIPLTQGRRLAPEDRGVVVMGVEIAYKNKVAPGDTLQVRGHPFQVVGVLDRTMTAPDNLVIMPLADAQELLLEDLPSALRPVASGLTTVIEVFPREGADFDEVAQRINDQVEGVKAISPRQFHAEVRRALVVFNTLILGSALIALVVGGLAVINTMVMSMTERIREIGIKKAVGATTGHILREYLAEAGAMGLLGGLLGLGLGVGVADILNRVIRSQGVTLFAVTPRLAVGAILFATLLGVVAGVYPAVRAARLNPVAALRSE